MGNKTNMSFFNSYMELDSLCAKALDVKKGGVSAYIGRLVELRFIPGRSDVLNKLIEYRKIRNIFAHEDGALSGYDRVTKADVQWINRFIKLVQKKKDPISLYDKKMRSSSVKRTLKTVLAVLIVVGAVALVFALLKLLKIF